jgi:6-phosphogluconate dehydrogenase (decarboxylating)
LRSGWISGRGAGLIEAVIFDLDGTLVETEQLKARSYARAAAGREPDPGQHPRLRARFGEGRWTVAEAIDLRCAIPMITLALQRRFRSREAEPFGDKLLTALRNQFGGHAVQRHA